jgi:hypothetical protein
MTSCVPTVESQTCPSSSSRLCNHGSDTTC